MRILLAASVAIVALASTSAAFAQNNGAKVNPSLRPTAPVTVPAAPTTRQIVVKGVDAEAPAPLAVPAPVTAPLPAPIADVKAAELAPPPPVKDIPVPAPAPVAPPAPEVAAAPVPAPPAADTSVAVATDLVEQTVKPKVEAPVVTEQAQVVKPVAPVKKKVHKQTYSYDDASYDEGYASGGYGDGCE